MDNKILIFLIALLSSCGLIISQDQDKKGVIAKVGEAYLYDDDIIYKIKESTQSRYKDMFFGNVPILRNKFSISISMPEIENIDKDILKVSYRGCAEAGFCYPMETVSFRISYKIL